MPPILALVLCTAFVVFMLRIERKISSGVTRALWIPVIWLLHTASKPLGDWFRSSGRDADYGSPLDRNFLIVLLCLGLIILIRRRFDWKTASRENFWLIALVAFMLISILWSPWPFISFKRWVRELLAVIMAFVILSERSPRLALECILRRTIYILIPFSLVLIKYFPKYGVDFARWSGSRMWVGVTQQKNGLGRLCVIASFFLIWSLMRRRKGYQPSTWKYHPHAELFILFLALWLLKGPGGGGYSATAIVAFCSGILTYAGLLFMRRSGIKVSAGPLLAMTGFIILFGIITVFAAGRTIGSFAPSIGRNATLTDRTTVWNALLPVAMRHPLLGYGFGGFWNPIVRQEYQISEAHSGYLDLLLSLGFIGVLFVTMFYMSTCKKAHRELSREFDWGAFWISFIVIILVHNITESSLDALTSHISALVVFFSVSASNLAARGLQQGEAELIKS